MNVKRIVAKTSREAMRQLREVLGPDAVILSNRAVEGGVEVLAMPAEAIASMAPPVDDTPPMPRADAEDFRSRTQDAPVRQPRLRDMPVRETAPHAYDDFPRPAPAPAVAADGYILRSVPPCRAQAGSIWADHQAGFLPIAADAEKARLPLPAWAGQRRCRPLQSVPPEFPLPPAPPRSCPHPSVLPESKCPVHPWCWRLP